jgi:hypothetical protein
MVSILKHDIRKYIGSPLLLLASIYIMFSIVERQGASENFEVFVLRMLTEHYLIIYCMTPIFLLSIFRNLEEDTPFLLVRCRNFTRYFYTKWMATSIYAILFVLFQVIIVLIMGIGLPHGNAYPVYSSVENELFYYFEAIFSTPIMAAISTSVYMMVGLAFVGVSILTVFHFFDRRVVTVMVLLAYGIMAFSIKIPALGSVPFITLNRYVILHHNFTMENGVLWSVAGMIVLLIVQIICIRFAWYRKLSLSWNVTRKGLYFYYAQALWTRKIILLLCGIVGILTIWKTMNGTSESMQDYLLRFFYGQEIGNFHLLTFLEQLIYYGTPLYLLAMFIETWCSDDNLPVFIRIKQKKKWLIAMVSNGLIFQTIYISLTFAVLFICGILTNKAWTANTIQISESTQSIWPIFIFLKIMEFSVLFLTFFLLFIWIKNVTAAFLIVMASHGFNLLSIALLSYNPTGLVTIARLQILEGSTGIPLNQAFSVLILGFILLLVFISRSYKRFFN